MQDGNAVKKRGAHSNCTPVEVRAYLYVNTEDAPQLGATSDIVSHIRNLLVFYKMRLSDITLINKL
jgi:hypothetical protein